jgi:hypothetical protein
MQMKNLVNDILNIITKCSSRSIFNAVNSSGNLFLICGVLYLLSLGECMGGPMSAANNQQSKQRQTESSQTSASGVTQNNATKIGSSAAPSRNVFERLKAFCAHKYTRAVVLAVNVTCFLYFVSELISDWLTRREPPNDQAQAQPPESDRDRSK